MSTLGGINLFYLFTFATRYILNYTRERACIRLFTLRRKANNGFSLDVVIFSGPSVRLRFSLISSSAQLAWTSALIVLESDFTGQRCGINQSVSQRKQQFFLFHRSAAQLCENDIKEVRRPR